jgi:hypothetical protein
MGITFTEGSPIWNTILTTEFLSSTLQMKGRRESNINVCFPFIYSQKWHCYSQFQYSHISVRVYIFPGSVCLFCCKEMQDVDRSWEHINHSQTHECGNWDWGHASPRKGIHKWDFLAVYTTRGAICSKVLPEKIYLCLALIAMSDRLCHHWQGCFFPAPPEAPLSLTYMNYQKKALACFGLSS